MVCLAFAPKALLQIDGASLRSDELYIMAKSFQSDFASLLALPRQDIHLDLNYSLLWLWGVLVCRPIAHHLSGFSLTKVFAMAGATLTSRGPQVWGSINNASKAGSRLLE